MGTRMAIVAGFASMLASGGASGQVYDYSLTTIGGTYADAYPNNAPVAFTGSVSVTWKVDASKLSVFNYGGPDEYNAQAQNVTVTMNGVTLPYAATYDSFQTYADRFYLNWKGASNFSLQGDEPIAFDGTTPLTDVPLTSTGGSYLQARLPDGSVRLFSFAAGSTFLFSFAPDGVAAVPEAATWATMLLGVGVIGAALRRRSTGARIAYV